MARPSKHDGAVFKRNDGKILWIRYRDREGKLVRESTFTEDWQEAQRKLRERLQARDDKLLEIARRGEQLQFSTWVDFSWRTIPSHLCEPRKHTRPICALPCI